MTTASGRGPIDFAGLAHALLQQAEHLVPQWLPGGSIRGQEYVCADLGGGRGSSLSVNLNSGAWADFGGDDGDRGGDLISLYAAVHGMEQGAAARELMEQLGLRRESVQAPTPRGAGGGAIGMDDRPVPPPEDGAAPARREKRKTMWRAIVPVPPTAPACDFWHWEYKQVERTWRYVFEGVVYGHVARFRTSDGGKEVVPYTWCVDEGDPRGLCKWHAKQWDLPRPLYVPRGELGDPSLVPVVLVEGEKCADAGHALLGDEFDFVSWPGGGNAWDKAAWGWLMGRTVILWPDSDAKRVRLSPAERKAGADPAAKPLLSWPKQPGMKAMMAIGSLLIADQGCTVTMCATYAPEKTPLDGWDIADAIESGWTRDQVRDFIRASVPFVAPDDAARSKAATAAAPPTPTNAGAGSQESGPDDRWRGCLLLTPKDAIASVRENIVMALDGRPERGIPGIEALAGLIAFNEFTNNVVKTRASPWGSEAGAWLEADELQMGDWLVREYWMPSVARATLEEAVLIVAHRHRFHPVRDRMLKLRGTWDRQVRLDTWLRRAFLQEDEFDDVDPLQRYLTLAGRWFVMALVCRVLPQEKVGAKIVRGPGTKFDYMLIFEGLQGLGKSSGAQVLGGEHFADTGLTIGEKDSYQNIQGILVYEWGELDALSRTDIRKVKQFVSSPKDRFRASFDRRPADYPRQVVFVGTTNERNYLSDPTGNRRFWPVACTAGEVDLAWLTANVDQMFAEALHRLDAGEKFWPSRDEQRLLFDPQQQERKVESSLEAALRRFLYDEDQHLAPGQANGALMNQIGLVELLTRVGLPIDKQSDVVVKNTGALMHAMGWTVRRLSTPGRPRVYQRPKDDALGAEARASSDSTQQASSTHPAPGAAPAGADDDPPF